MKSRKGLSDGITTFIIILVSIAAVLVVVSYALAFMGGYVQTLPTVKQVGPGQIKDGYLYVYLDSTGNVKIVSVGVNGYLSSVSIKITPGSHHVEIPLPSGFKPQNGTIYIVNLGLSDGESVVVSASPK